jgi:ABC-type polysaccharide/polyol phosphate export permease
MSHISDQRSRASVRGAIATLVRTDFKSRYHGTVMGFFWALLKPMAISLVLILVFSVLFSSNDKYGIHLVIGIFLYEFFGESTKVGMASLLTKSFVIAKSSFPRWIIVVASTANPLLTLLVASVAVIGYLYITAAGPSLLHIGLYLSYLVATLLISIGFSLAASVLLLRYRDLNQIWEVVVQAGFFVAPVIYPLSVLPERFHVYVYMWIPTPLIEFSRAVLADNHIPTLKAHGLLWASVAASLICGWQIHRLLVPRAAEYL